MPEKKERKFAFRCYDHLGGILGEVVYELFLSKKWLERDKEGEIALTGEGRKELDNWGFPLDKLDSTKRKPVCSCVERFGGQLFPHIGAYLGGLLLDFFTDKKWLIPSGEKEFILTPEGEKQLSVLGWQK